MKVILRQDIKDIGKRDEVKDVAEGFARNFLFPRQLAEAAGDAALQSLKERQARATSQAEADLAETQTLAQRLDNLELRLARKADEDGTLYGSVTKAIIAEELTKLDYGEIKKDSVVLDEPIKTVGECTVALTLPHGLEATIRVVVDREPD
ncbi:MAG: 50S ribosomal protein L9 [bacterium]|nr:50S ribosomal protein L9 [bacterium]MDZ4296183.1 50S ribosomal protein L9 [Patescibacteria group bacterium]